MASAAPTVRPSHHGDRGSVRRRLVVASAAAILSLSAGLSTGVAASSPLGDPAVIPQWNLIAQSTLLGDATKRPQEHFLYLAFMNIAIYDAVVGIDGRYEPYSLHASPPAGASDQAAAVAAAYRILWTYSPYAQSTLNGLYATSLAAIPPSQAKDDGIAFGTLAADNLIALRANDGRNANITFDKPPAPGVWRPTPPAFAPMFVPWMGSVTPLVLKSGAQFGEPGLPYSLTSKQYTTDFNEVKSMGGNAATGSNRTADQTATALFFSGNAQVQYTGALIDQATKRSFDIVDTARLFAAVNTSIADALISVWHAKLLYGFWRPITAITLADTDGNPDTTINASWVPLIPTGTPAYPEYVSGYSGVTGAFSRSLQQTLGTGQLDITVGSTAAAGTRQFAKAGDLNEAVINARIWLGIHFRAADVDGVKMGQHAANWVLGHAFQPLGG